MTYILAIDTTLGACSVALLQDDIILHHASEIRARGHVERLLPMIDEVCVAAKTQINDVDYIAVTQGPGTFAGVRIGLSAAKGLGLALDIPLIVVTSLDAIAYGYAAANENFNGNFAVVIDARRGEVYLKLFKTTAGQCHGISVAKAVAIDKVKDKIADNINVMVGSGSGLLKDIINDENIIFPGGYANPDPSMIAKFAAMNIDMAMMADDVAPLYLRAPDAIVPKKQNMTIIDE